MIKLAELRASTVDLERVYASLMRSEGNPNHDAEGKFASAPGGGHHGKHWAKRQRKRKRKLHEFAAHELGTHHAGSGFRQAKVERRQSRKRVYDTREDPNTHRRGTDRLQAIYDAKPLYTSPTFHDAARGETIQVVVTKNASHFSERDQAKFYAEERMSGHVKYGSYGGDAEGSNTYAGAVKHADRMTARLHNDPDIDLHERSLFRSEGNPNHDAEGKFASSGGSGHGHGKHHAKRQRRKERRKAKLEAMRKEYKGLGKDIKKEHRTERQKLTKERRKVHAELKSEHVKEKASHRKGEAKEKKELLRDQKRERTSLSREHGKDVKHAEKGHAARQAKVEAGQSAKAQRIAKGEKHLQRMEGRHKAEQADLVKKHGELAGTVAKLHAKELEKAKAGGAGPAEIAAIEAKQAKQRESSGKYPAAEKAKLEARHTAEQAKGKAFGEKLAGLKERLAKQTSAKQERVKAVIEKDRTELKAEHSEAMAGLKAEHKAARKEKVEELVQGRSDLKETHKEEWKSLKEEHAEARQDLRDQHKDERENLVESLKEELRTEGFYGKGRRDPTEPRGKKDDGQRDGSGAGLAERGPGWRVGGVAVSPQKFASSRTHKASSAESILRHCLRQRGWTGAYARGALSGRQRLRLLESIRRYARAWLRHEAEAFFRQYGHEVERGLTGAIARHVGRFFQRAKQFVHETILAGTLAFFDPTAEPMTEDDMREVDNQAQEQARYFDRFHQEVASNPPLEIAEPTPSPSALQPATVKQFVARAEQYGDAAWGAAQQVNRKRMIRGGQYTQEMRVHGKYVDDMCDTCRNAVEQGWVPIGTLPAIGDSECLGNCHCFFKYADADGNVATTVRKMKRRRKAG